MITGLSPEVERIIEAGNNAPSGENCQPWRFVVKGSAIEVHLRPERDRSAYSTGQRSSYLACGAVVENMVIAASIERFRALVREFPNEKDENHVATVTLVSDPGGTPDPLAEFIPLRMSNRKPYAKRPLTAEEREALYAVAPRDGSFVLVEDRDHIARLARIGSTNEEVMLGNRVLHDFFFSHVSWTKEQDERNKVGFYIKTLELPPPARALFRVFSSWTIMRPLAALGFTKIIAKQNASVNASVSAIAAFLLPAVSPSDFFGIGRDIERFWLGATALGFSLQPLTGVLFFKLKLEADEDGTFSAKERAIVESAYDAAADILHAGDKHVAFMFRLGKGSAPSAHAIRFPLSEVVTVI